MPIEDSPSTNNSRRRNRETFTRLFQGFVNDYGNESGEKIIKHIVDEAGGLRIRIPRNNGDPLYICSACFRRLWRSTCKKFGKASGRAIMNKIVVEFGGSRIYFPDYEYLYRRERDRKIRDLYNRDNRSELALRFKLHPDYIREIIKR